MTTNWFLSALPIRADDGRTIAALVTAAPTSVVVATRELKIGEASVAIVSTAPHRGEAFAACRAAIDRLKTTVPIWKKEHHPDGTSDWVDPTRK